MSGAAKHRWIYDLELGALAAPLATPAELQRADLAAAQHGDDLDLAGGQLPWDLRDRQEAADVGVGEGAENSLARPRYCPLTCSSSNHLKCMALVRSR